MAYVQAYSACYSCKRLIAYNPDLVPSIRINGVREPVCRACIQQANPVRIAKGLQPITISPGAYEASDENDLMS
jgi:hypothetical protein